MKLTKLIFDYWKYWMRKPECLCHTEGIYHYSNSDDAPSVMFWWALNASWYKMNNKALSYQWCRGRFRCPEDFEGIL